MLSLSKKGILSFETVSSDAAYTWYTLCCAALALPWLLTWLVERFRSKARAVFTATALLGWVSLPYGIAFAVKYSRPYWAAHWLYQGVWSMLIVNALLVWFIPLPKHEAPQNSEIRQEGWMSFLQKAALSIASGLMMITAFGFIADYIALGEMAFEINLSRLHRTGIMPESVMWTYLVLLGAFLVLSAMALPGVLSWLVKRFASEMKSVFAATMLFGLATAPICATFAVKYAHSGRDWAVVWFCGLLATLTVAALVVRFVSLPERKEAKSAA